MGTEKITISTKDVTNYNLISEVIYGLFLFEGKSILKGADYKITENERVWFINFESPEKIEETKKKDGYVISHSENLTKIYFYNNNGHEKAQFARYKKVIESKEKRVVFAKFKDKYKENNYKFIGVFSFEKCLNDSINYFQFRRVAEEFSFTKQK